MLTLMRKRLLLGPYIVKKKAAGRASYVADPDKKKAAVTASYVADPDKKKAAVRALYVGILIRKRLLLGPCMLGS